MVVHLKRMGHMDESLAPLEYIKLAYFPSCQKAKKKIGTFVSFLKVTLTDWLTGNDGSKLGCTGKDSKQAHRKKEKEVYHQCVPLEVPLRCSYSNSRDSRRKYQTAKLVQPKKNNSNGGVRR